MKIIAGILLLALVASASSWSLSSIFDTKEEKSEVILNPNTGDQKEIQTGQPSEKAQGIISDKEANDKLSSTSSKVEDSSKQSEKGAVGEKPVDLKVIKEEIKNSKKEGEEKKIVDGKVIAEGNKDSSLKKDEEKKDSPKKDEGKLSVEDKIKEGEVKKEETKYIEKESGDKKPIVDKILLEENKESLKKEEEKKDLPKKDEGKLSVGEKVKGEETKHSEKDAGEKKPAVEKVILEETKIPEKEAEVKNPLDEKKIIKEETKPFDVEVNMKEKEEVNKENIQIESTAPNSALVIESGHSNSKKPGSDAFQPLLNRDVYNPYNPQPQGFYQPEHNPIRSSYPSVYPAGYPANYPSNYPYGTHQQYSSYYQRPQQQHLNAFINYPSQNLQYQQQNSYDGFVNQPVRNRPYHHPTTNYQQAPTGYPIHQNVQPAYYPYATNRQQQKPIYFQHNKKKNFFRPNFRLEHLYYDDSSVLDDEFYLPNKEDDNVEEEGGTAFAKEAVNDDVDSMKKTKEQDDFIDRLTPKQIEGLYRLLEKDI